MDIHCRYLLSLCHCPVISLRLRLGNQSTDYPSFGPVHLHFFFKKEIPFSTFLEFDIIKSEYQGGSEISVICFNIRYVTVRQILQNQAT